MNKCEICLYPKGEIIKFRTYQPTTGKKELHFVCEKCIKKLVEKYFSRI